MRTLLFIAVLAAAVWAQSGGQYAIESSAFASGGHSSTGRFELLDAISQTTAGGRVRGGQFVMQSGFWTFDFAPTAAHVAISGRVMAASGQGIRNARVVLTGTSGETRISQTGSFGFYRFDDVPVGATFILSVFSQRFVFQNSSRVVDVIDEISDLDFIAIKL